MLAEARDRVTALPEDLLVLDVGGWAYPLSRADWVLDLMPYATRGLYGDPDPEPERFSERTWVKRDICDREPWPFGDDQFDFVVCSHTLEDVRDPIWVCSELCRVAKAGYVEVPSRLEEQTYAIHGPWVGWSHHHWLIDLTPAGFTFVFKSHAINGRRPFSFPAGFAAGLTAEERVESLYWEGSFGFGERIFLDPEGLDEYITGFVRENAHRESSRRSLARRALARLSRAAGRRFR